MGCLVFDLDHISYEKVESISKSLDDVASIVHSTHSHNEAKDDWCLRLVIQLTRPLQPQEVRAVRAGVIAQYGIPADAATVDEGRIYFLPSHVVGGEYLFSINEGVPLDPAHFLGYKPKEQKAVASVDQSNAIDLAAAIEELKTCSSPEVRRVLRGDKLAEPGARDAVINRTVWKILSVCPELTPEACVHLMGLSLDKMDPPERGNWRDIALEKARRGSETLVAQRTAAREASKTLKAAFFTDPKVKETFEAGGDYKYTDEELARWAQEQNCEPHELNSRLIINNSTAYWVFVDGEYRSPLSRESLENSLKRDLLRAHVQISDVDKNGVERARNTAHILRDCCTVARVVKGSLSLKRSYYDAERQTFWEALAPIKLEPMYSAEVQEYLTLLSAGNKEFLDWVAGVPLMDEYLALMFIHSPAGVGKTLFAEGMAKLWGLDRTPTKWGEAFGGNFNERLAECPFIFADEALPNDRKTMEIIRSSIGNSSLSIARKFMPTVQVEGRLRLFVAANNDSVFDAPDSRITAQDLEAVADRIIYLSFGQAHANRIKDYFEHLKDVNKDPTYLERMKASGAIARHALWMSQNHKIDRGHRFLVQGKSEDFHERLLTTQPTTGRCLEFLVRYLSDENAHASNKCVLLDGRLLVSTELLADKTQWESYVPSSKVPSSTAISQSLGQLSLGRVQHEGRTYHDIRTDLLYRWAQRMQVGEPLTLAKKIRTGSE